MLVDGVDVRDYPTGKLRSKIGIVPQKAVLFAGHHRVRISAGARKTRRTRELQARSRTAQAAEFVCRPAKGGLDAEDRAGRQATFPAASASD